MATLLYWADPDTGHIEAVRFDAVLSEVPEDTVTITDHPVELGANVTDHARPEPERLTIEAIVSNIPNLAVDTDTVTETAEFGVQMMADPGTKTIILDVQPSPIAPSINGLVRAGVGALTSSITGPPRATVMGDIRRQTTTIKARVLRQRAPRNRIRDLYDLLLKAKNGAYLIAVNTAHREYSDMLIERLAEPRTAGDGSKARFELDLKRIRVAASETVQAPKPAEPRGQPAQKKGSQAAKPDPNAEKKESYVSAAKRLKDFGFSLGAE